MKKMKKLVGLLLTMLMALGMMTTVLAADPTITAPADSRSYAVYQIFKCDLSGDTLSNVVWGKNGTGTENEKVSDTVLSAVAAITGSDAVKASEIAAYVNFSSEPVGKVTNGSPLTVPTGYYLIKDNGPVGEGEAYSLYVVQVAGPTTISPKTGTTTSEKKVKDINDSISNSLTGWQDSADYDIGDAVPFQLKATIASDYANYQYAYKLTFHDKEGKGLTFDSSSVKVYVDGNQIDKKYYTVTAPAADGDTFDVSFANLKDIKVEHAGSDITDVHAGSVITVEYTSTINENANIGSLGNKNESHITYTNNPNDSQSGENGKTPNDTVIVFTYKVVANKVDQNDDPLTGAGFTLYKKNASGEYVAVGAEVKGENMTTFEWIGIDDGDYKIVETTTPAGYNTIAPIEFTVTADHEILSDNPALKSLSGGNTFTGEVSTGAVSANIVNKAGTTLPETGGIGTTIFYILGTILVIAAAILLITKKRMSNQE